MLTIDNEIPRLQRYGGEDPMKAPTTMRRLVAISVIASVIVALTASLASAAPRPKHMIILPPSPCIGNVGITLTLADARRHIPIPYHTIVVATEIPRTGALVSPQFNLGMTSSKGYLAGTFPATPFCDSANDTVRFTVAEQVFDVNTRKNKLIALTNNIRVVGPFIPTKVVNFGALQGTW